MFKRNFDFLLSVNEFCQKNGIKIIASGITSSTEKELLEKLGIYFQQGFHYSQAKNISELISVDKHEVKLLSCS